MMNGNVIFDVKSRLEACAQPKCMSSQTQFSAQVQVHWIHTVPLQHGREGRRCLKSGSCKNRNYIAGQSIDIEWHVGLGDTFVHTLHRFQSIHDGERAHTCEFPRQDHPPEHVQRHRQLGKSSGANKMSTSSERRGYLHSKIQTWLLTWTTNEERPSHQFAGGEWDKSLS